MLQSERNRRYRERAKLVPFADWHLPLVCLRADDADRPLVETFGEATGRMIAGIPNGAAFTMTYQGNIVACAGVVPLWPGVAQGWCIGSIYVHELRWTFVKLVKSGMATLENEFNLHRLQATVMADNMRSQRWLKRLGFKNETPEGMAGYGPHGETFYLYARTR